MHLPLVHQDYEPEGQGSIPSGDTGDFVNPGPAEGFTWLPAKRAGCIWRDTSHAMARTYLQ